MTRHTTVVVVLILLAAASVQAQRIEIRSLGSRPHAAGPTENFTGVVFIEALFAATEDTRASAGHVAFTPGARTAWHTHPAGQTLIVTSGVGWVQEWNGGRREIKTGDVVWTPPGVKHWHGATSTNGMAHIAIQEHVAGRVVEWMELVTDEHYER